MKAPAAGLAGGSLRIADCHRRKERNITTLYSPVLEGNNPYMVMEFVHGRPLDEIVRERGKRRKERSLFAGGRALRNACLRAAEDAVSADARSDLESA